MNNFLGDLNKNTEIDILRELKDNIKEEIKTSSLATIISVKDKSYICKLITNTNQQIEIETLNKLKDTETEQIKAGDVILLIFLDEYSLRYKFKNTGTLQKHTYNGAIAVLKIDM